MDRLARTEHECLGYLSGQDGCVYYGRVKVNFPLSMSLARAQEVVTAKEFEMGIGG